MSIDEIQSIMTLNCSRNTVTHLNQITDNRLEMTIDNTHFIDAKNPAVARHQI